MFSMTPRPPLLPRESVIVPISKNGPTGAANDCIAISASTFFWQFFPIIYDHYLVQKYGSHARCG